MKLIHITDTHIRPAGGTIYGLDPAARLSAVVADVRRRHRDAELVVITGDLADAGEPEAYALLRQILAPLPMPVRLLLGNHDRRAAFRAAFPEVPVDEHGYVQSVIDGPEDVGRLIFLDTLEDRTIGGVLCDRRLGWLAARLSDAGAKPVTLFLHHPPLPIGVPHFGPICLHDPERFLALLRSHPGGVRHLFVGHLHLPFSGTIRGGLPITAARSSNHLMSVDFEDPGARWIAGSPAYNVVILERDAVFVHPIDRIDDVRIGYGEPCAGP